MTWVRFKKGQIFNGKKYPIGYPLNIETSIAKELVAKDEAIFYNGPRPVVDKMEVELFKPKETVKDGNTNKTGSKRRRR